MCQAGPGPASRQNPEPFYSQVSCDLMVGWEGKRERKGVGKSGGHKGWPRGLEVEQIYLSTVSHCLCHGKSMYIYIICLHFKNNNNPPRSACCCCCCSTLQGAVVVGWGGGGGLCLFLAQSGGGGQFWKAKTPPGSGVEGRRGSPTSQLASHLDPRSAGLVKASWPRRGAIQRRPLSRGDWPRGACKRPPRPVPPSGSQCSPWQRRRAGQDG